MTFSQHGGGMTTVLLTVLALVFMSMLLSSCETGLTGATYARLYKLKKQNRRLFERLHKILDEREAMLGAILIGNNLTNIVASVLTTAISVAWFGEGWGCCRCLSYYVGYYYYICGDSS